MCGEELARSCLGGTASWGLPELWEPSETALQRNLPLQAAIYSLQHYSSRASNRHVQLQSRKCHCPHRAVGRSTGLRAALGRAAAPEELLQLEGLGE